MNRLAQETSPYLLQHADNPVEWQPWGQEALDRARSERKPLLVSIGYSACHWCHVMEHESFADEATAALMNELFVSVKVDREERPDVDAVYMDAVVALTGQGGWPLTVFLTPDGEPFFGGTYFPPEPRHGLPSFRQVLRVPHFEKMLYDNALLVPPFLHAWLLTGEERYRVVAEQTLDYMVRELRLPSGGFASSQDADTDGIEGLTYTWTAEEGAPAELLQPFEHGRSILRGELDSETRAQLLEIRDRRPQPALDDKVIAAWNGLALAALAEGARRLERSDLLATACELGALLSADPLWRTLRDDRPKYPAYLEDYANVGHGLYELHVATGDLRWLREARRVALAAVELFGDPDRGGFFLAPADGERLVARQKAFDDNPTPAGSSMLAFVLLRLARIWGDDGLERKAVGALRLVRDLLPRAPQAFGWALCALDLHLSPPRELAIVGGPDSDVGRAALGGFDPNAVVAFGPADDVPLLEGKTLVDGKPAVYVCERFACRAPVTEPAELS